MHNLDPQQSNYNAQETRLTPSSIAAAKGLVLKWKAPILGATIGTPLLLNQLTLPNGTVMDVVYQGACWPCVRGA